MFKTGDVVTEDVTMTDQMIRDFASSTGDFNPIHMDEAYAKKTVFGRRIAHGMLSGGLISRVLAMRLGTGGIYLSQSLKFLKPVFIGDVLHIKIVVRNFREEKGLASIDTTVQNQQGDFVVKGDATIMIARRLGGDPVPKV